MASNELKVSVELAAHEVMQTAAQRLFDQHGLMLHSVHFGWLDVSTMEKTTQLVSSVKIHSESRHEGS